MSNLESLNKLWAALYEYKKDQFSKLLKDSILRAESNKEIEAARGVLSDFIIRMYADLDYVSKGKIDEKEIENFWNHLSPIASKDFKAWIEVNQSLIEKDGAKGISELKKNIDEFLDRATKYHTQIQKLSIK